MCSVSLSVGITISYLVILRLLINYFCFCKVGSGKWGHKMYPCTPKKLAGNFNVITTRQNITQRQVGHAPGVTQSTVTKRPYGDLTFWILLSGWKKMAIPSLSDFWMSIGKEGSKHASLTGGNWQKWKRVFLTCPCHKIYRDEAIGLKSCKNTWKITMFVKMWNLRQYRENLIFCQ